MVLVIAMLRISGEGAHAQVNHSPPPWQQGVTEQQMQQAQRHFQIGVVLHKQLLLEEAAVEYEQALMLWKHPKIYLYLGRVWMKLRRPVPAYKNLREALRWGQEGLLAHDYEMARQMEKELFQTQIAEIDVVCREAGAEVTLDGRALFIGPAQHRVIVTAGKHEIVAKKPGHLTETRSLAVFPGEQQHIDIELRSVEEIAGAERRWQRWKPWAVLGAGAAVAVIGALTHTAAATNFERYDHEFAERCPPPEGCLVSGDDDLTERLHRARIQQRFAVGSYAVGGLAVACGILLLSLNEPKTSIARSPGPERRGIALMPVSPLSPGFGISAEIPF